MFHHTMPVAFLLALSLLVPAASASAPKKSGADRLWATVNVCKTEGGQNIVGFRGSMPGTGRKGVMYMRFRAQYLSKLDGKWHNIASGADSGFIRVGTSRDNARESGWTFRFKGGPQTMRGAVSYEWRRSPKRGAKVLRTAKRLTEAGHTSTVGADPAGYSAATCVLSA